MKTQAFPLLFFVLAFFPLFTPLFAQGISLQISPIIYETSASPGEVKVISDFEFFNPFDTPQTVQVDVQDIIIFDETGGLQIVKDSHSRYSLSKWVEIKPKTFILGPKEHRTVELRIRVPDDAEPGGHYGAVYGEVKPPSATKKDITGVSVKAGVVSPILFIVRGPVSYSGEIIEFKKVSFVNLGPVKFLLRFKNTGTVHYKPHGIIEIFDWFGKKIDVVTVPEKRVFPQTIRQLPAIWNRKLLFGKYKAVATIWFGAEDERRDRAEIYFWAFPYKPFFVLLGVIFLLWLVRRIKRRLRY